jgi:phage shock protein A
MSYFSRLTDIVTCNLTALLAEADDPQAALSQIIREMDEGLSGARRSVSAATASEQRLLGEINEHRKQSADWAAEARRHVAAGSDDAASTAPQARGRELDRRPRTTARRRSDDSRTPLDHPPGPRSPTR